jgi:murein DD-endopeptidase MepM/ murein hydrolase activator NlpD
MGEISANSAALKKLTDKLDVLISRSGGTSGRISGSGFGNLNFGIGTSNAMANSLATMSAPDILASARAANLKYSSLIGLGQMGAGLFAGANLAMPNLQQSLARGTSFYNAGVFANTNYQGLATHTMNMMRGGISEIGGDAQTANTLIGMGVNPNSAQYRNLVTSTSNAAKYLNMGNQQAATALGSLTQGSTSQSLMRNFGTWTTDPTTGRRLAPTEIFSQMYQRITAGQKLTRDDIMTSLQGGALSVDLQNSGMSQDQQNLFAQYAMDRASGKNMDLGSKKAMDKLFNQTNATVGSNPSGPGMQINSAVTGALNDALQPFVKGMQDAVPIIQSLETASGALAKQFGSLSATLQTVLGTGPAQGALAAGGGIMSGLGTIGGAMLLNGGLKNMMGGVGSTGAGAAPAGASWNAKAQRWQSNGPGRQFVAGPKGGPAPAAGGSRLGSVGKSLGIGLGAGIAGQAASSIITANGGSSQWANAASMAGSFAGTGALIGSAFGPGLGTAIGAGVGAIAGGLVGYFTGGDTSTVGTGSTSSTNLPFKLARPVSAAVTLGYGVVDDMHPQGHHGIDFGCGPNTPVQAAFAGVAKSYWSGDLGNVVEVDHGNGYTTMYCHLNSSGVQAGMAVTQGQVIGGSGNTGKQTTGAHLHFALKGPSGYENPAKFLAGGVAVSGGQMSLGGNNGSEAGAVGAAGSAGAAGTLGFSNDYTAPKTAGGVPQAYSGAAIAGAAVGSASSASMGRGANVQGGAQGSMSTGTSNSNQGGGTGSVKSNNFNITVNIAQASESEARKFAQMIKGYIEEDTLITNMGRL